ncbi:MAG: RteC domain-containing protein [Bacteroidota bacterium]
MHDLFLNLDKHQGDAITIKLFLLRINPFHEEVKIDSTIQDGRHAKIIAKEVKIYIQHPEPRSPSPSASLKWTGPKVALIEMIYALQSSGVFQNGAADIKQVTAFFESVCGVELGNVYNSFQEMRLRKKNRAVFLDLLRDRLIQRMDEADER